MLDLPPCDFLKIFLQKNLKKDGPLVVFALICPYGFFNCKKKIARRMFFPDILPKNDKIAGLQYSAKI